MLRRSQTACLLALTAVLAVLPPCQARNIWDINHGMSNPPIPAGSEPHGPTVYGQSPKDFWKGQMANTIPSGTVLTAILETNLSSSHNKKGDVFTLTLQDGFQLNGKVLIPPNAKIVGAVNNAVAAKNMKGGMPGKIDISIQSLVLPDGRHYPFHAFIDGNPNDKHKEPSVRKMGTDIRDIGQSIKSMGWSFISGPGFMAAKRLRGKDFSIDKGEALPVRLTQDFEAPKIEQLVTQPNKNGVPGGLPDRRGVSADTKGYLDPSGPYHIPGFVPSVNNSGQPQAAPPGLGQNGGQLQAARPTVVPSDPNAVFNQPLVPSAPGNAPDPF